MKRFLILALQHQRVAALKRENERLQNLNQQKADDISFLKHSYQTREGVNRQNAAYVSAFAALAGSVIGGLTTLR